MQRGFWLKSVIRFFAFESSDASRIEKVENRARTRILDFQKFENEKVENFSTSNFRESRTSRSRKIAVEREIFENEKSYQISRDNIKPIPIVKFKIKIYNELF